MLNFFWIRDNSWATKQKLMKVIKRHALQKRLMDIKKKDSIFFRVQPLTRSSRIGFLLAFVSLIEFSILTGNYIVYVLRDVLLY